MLSLNTPNPVPIQIPFLNVITLDLNMNKKMKLVFGTLQIPDVSKDNKEICLGAFSFLGLNVP